MRLNDYSRFWKRFATMLSSGVPLMVILRILQRELAASPLGEVLQSVIGGLEKGEHFSDGLARFPGLFGNDLLVMVKAGEAQGRLDRVAKAIAKQVRKGVLRIPVPVLDGDSTSAAPETCARGEEWAGDRLPASRELIREALQARASDVHVEPVAGGAGVVRFRVDGTLELRREVDRADYRPLVAQFKLMSGLDVAEERLPQDGRVRIRSGEVPAEFRVATSPSVLGEAVCLRFVNEPNWEPGKMAIEAVIPDEQPREQLLGLMAQPWGLLLLAGPDGSGCRTTSRALLAHLDAEHRKVLSVEDPVEVVLPHVHHVQIRPDIGLTFPATLRHFLRLDPDVVHCSSVREAKTAALLARIGLGSHLALGVLEAGDALDGLVWLLGLKLEPYLLSGGLLGIASQRLARRLCPACRRPSVEATQRLRELAGAAVPEDATACEATGCADCRGHGYRGFRAIFEVLPIGPNLKRCLRRGATRPELEAAARSDGFKTLLENGVAPVLAGETSLAEVVRICPDCQPAV
ncbi:MAG: Flp pilus assembly complex ATPase component TadA [Candidatus Riflebacteria bacterium]|nr:Flp pilus assembly complex ATPase component TadA [Candidatus Riflebacteria bacterium]